MRVVVDDIIASIEAARDKVMVDEVRALVKLGLPRNMAQQTVNQRFHIKADEEEGGNTDFEPSAWQDIS
ncbi:MAG: hypothetical protein ACYDGR_01295 [Candidatus Dormibacteria bacterium]